MHPPIDGGTILITGASAGIGRELARQFAPRARALVLVARRSARLELLQDELRADYPTLTVHVAPCDLSDSAAIDAMLAEVTRQVDPVDILINNAGIGDQALYEQADWSRIERMIRVNVIAIALLTRRLVPGMVMRHRGGILNISSGAGVALLPGEATYVGTKHFVTGFTETLRAELAETGVVVTQVLPGPVETEFEEAAGITRLAAGPPEFLRISSATCAREAIAGFERGQAMVFPGRVYRVTMMLQAIAPRFVQRMLARSMARQLRRAARVPAGTARSVTVKR
jgi:short-subunit dehydrogenase